MLRNIHGHGRQYIRGERVAMGSDSDNLQKLLAEQSLLSKFCLDNSALCFFRHDSRGRFLYANPKASQSLGYSLEELLQMSVCDIDPTMMPEDWPKLWQTMCDHRSITIEAFNRRKDGTVFPVEVNANILDYGGERFAAAFVQDITERVKAREILLLNQFSFDRAAIGIFRCAADARILNVNECACRYLGYTQEELCSRTIFDIDPLVNAENWGGIWMKLCEDKITSFETEHRMKNGTVLPVEITANLLEYGGEQYSISFARDITQRKNNAKQQEKLEAHLQQAQRLESLGKLAGGIAHDFNNILSAIMGYAELTGLLCQDSPKARHYLDQLGVASHRAKDLVQQILSFSRQSNSEKHPVDIGTIVNEALNLIRATVPSSVEISRNVFSNQGTVVANETQIHQIIMNLCTNAYQAMEDNGGSIDVDLVPVTISGEDALHYPDLNPGRYLKLLVTDTGQGIPPELLPKIFDPYFTTKKVGEGSGLGLSTVHGIVKDHGGSIKVYSELNRGTTFQIFLPISAAKPETTGPVVTKLPRGTERILFVDDELFLLEIGKELLEGLGYRVETRANPIDALEAFRAHPEKYDLIVSDMTMPKATGDVLALAIKKIRPDIPAILCTGFSTRLNIEKMLSSGIAKVLVKPVTYGELASSVRIALDQANPSQNFFSKEQN